MNEDELLMKLRKIAAIGDFLGAIGDDIEPKAESIRMIGFDIVEKVQDIEKMLKSDSTNL